MRSKTPGINSKDTCEDKNISPQLATEQNLHVSKTIFEYNKLGYLLHVCDTTRPTIAYVLLVLLQIRSIYSNYPKLQHQKLSCVWVQQWKFLNNLSTQCKSVLHLRPIKLIETANNSTRNIVRKNYKMHLQSVEFFHSHL